MSATTGKVGRPPIGHKVQVHIPPAILARVDEIASSTGVTRSDVIRRLLGEALGS